MRWLYEYGIRLFTLGIRAAALFSLKARLWVNGRRNWRMQLEETQAKRKGKRVLWLHAASLGEFEQGRPLIEAYREQFPDSYIALTFFSPSGYEVRKNYPLADLVAYLPADTRRNARDFLDLLRPDLAIFVKYEFWGNYLLELKSRKTSTLLVAALFRPSQAFFQPWGGFWRKMLGCFTHLFVQREEDARLLQSFGVQCVTVAGDTRVDRVLKIAAEAPANEKVAGFVGAAKQVLVAGSTWQPDEQILLDALSQPSLEAMQLVIAPHDPAATHVERLLEAARFLGAKRYSVADSYTDERCLVIDNIGMLNTLYRYGRVAYIGGGFGKGIHNTLEPAAFGLPVIFGPKYQKFEEARQFVARGGAFVVHDAAQLHAVLAQLQQPEFYRKASEAVQNYLEESRGATSRVMAYIKTMHAVAS